MRKLDARPVYQPTELGRFEEATAEVVSVGSAKVKFRLSPPNTYESLVEDTKVYAEQGKTRRCRWFRCKFQTIGEPFIPEYHGTVAMLLAVVSSTDTRDLVRCERCSRVTVRSRF